MATRSAVPPKPLSDKMKWIIKPPELDRADLTWSGCRGTDIWEMFCAAISGDVQAIQTLLVRDPKLLHAEYWYTPPIHFAVREGRLEAVKALVQAGADVAHHSSVYGGESLVTIANDRGHYDVADLLAGAIYARYRSHGTDQEIHLAVSAGEAARVRKLVKRDPESVNAGDALGRRPLHRAIEKGRLDLIAYLLDQGAEIDATGFAGDAQLGASGFRPIDSALWHNQYWRQRNNYLLTGYLLGRGAAYTITIAAAIGDAPRVRHLLAENRALANDQEPCGKRPLSTAAEHGDTEMVRLLLDHGADPKLPESRTCPKGFALWAASTGNHIEIAELLLNHGADPNGYVDSSGSPTFAAKSRAMKALMYRHGGRLSLFDAIFSSHAELMDVIASGLESAAALPPGEETPYAAAVKTSNMEVLHVLLARGVRMPEVVTRCQTYLWHNPAMTRVLLQNGMNPNLPNWLRMTPLHHIAREGNLDKARLFLEFKADINAIDEEYSSTPLGWAAREGKLEMAAFLLEHGADPNLPKDTPWASPLAWARKRGHQEVAELLVKHEAIG